MDRMNRQQFPLLQQPKQAANTMANNLYGTRSAKHSGDLDIEAMVRGVWLSADNKTQPLHFSLSRDTNAPTNNVPNAVTDIPEKTHTLVLDFGSVRRVTSVELTRLIRYLESWKKAGVKIEATNLNRMVSILFKMTGLNRYFGEKAVADTAPRPLSTVTPVSPNTPPATESTGQKMTFLVNLQNNQQLSGWYFLNTLLQRRLGRSMSMVIKQLDQHPESHQHTLVFAKPFDACALMTHYGYIPVARPESNHVEISIIVRSADRHKVITDFAGAHVATSTEASFVFLLGRFFCDESGLDSAKLSYHFTGSPLKGIRQLLDKEADMLFMQKDNYQRLSPLSRQGTHLLDESETGMAHHMLLISPAFATLQQQIAAEFLRLPQDTQGKRALHDLGIEAWCKPEPDEIAMLQMLYGRYVK